MPHIGLKTAKELLILNTSLSIWIDTWEQVKPIERIDVRTFDHDQRVMESRILLEDQEKVAQWQSDRQLKAEYFNMYGPVNGRDCTPDGV